MSTEGALKADGPRIDVPITAQVDTGAHNGRLLAAVIGVHDDILYVASVWTGGLPWGFTVTSTGPRTPKTRRTRGHSVQESSPTSARLALAIHWNLSVAHATLFTAGRRRVSKHIS